MRGSRKRIRVFPAKITFFMMRPDWYRRYVVMVDFGEGRCIPVMRTWSWDRADTLIWKLEQADYARRETLQ